jgi:probable phosphoglycerate mutase
MVEAARGGVKRAAALCKPPPPRILPHMGPPGLHDLPKLVLVRHGDTEWTDTRRHTGRTDVPLNSRGEERARQLGVLLRHQAFAQVFTSPLVRARRTCELAGYGDRAVVEPALAEWDYGDYEGRTTADIRRQQPSWNLFRDGAPGGETIAQVAARVDTFLARARAAQGNVLAFSSGHTIRVIAARWLGLAPDAARLFYTATASIGVLGYEHDLGEPVVLLWNSVTTDPLAPRHTRAVANGG